MTDESVAAAAPATDEKIEERPRRRRRRVEIASETPAHLKWLTDPLMAVVGRLVVLEECVVKLQTESEQQREQIKSQDVRIKRLEERLSELSRPDRLMTQKEVAVLLGVSVASLGHWRKERPPRIPFVLFEGGDVRYRVDVVESYLKSCERGKRRS
jgi:cell division protein FtsL